MTPQWDIAVIGSGHAGLTAAAFLTKAGQKCIVLEKHPHRIGGQSTTDEGRSWPGYKLDIGTYVMWGIAPLILQELVPDFPLIEIPGLYHITGRGIFATYRSLDDTCESIAKISKEDADVYRKIATDTEQLSNVFLKFAEPYYTFWDFSRDIHEASPMIEDLVYTSAEKMYDYYGLNQWIRPVFGRLTMAGGANPFDMGSGLSALLQVAIYHALPSYRPKGGFLPLMNAIKEIIKRGEGSVRTDAQVCRILVKEGVAKGVELTTGEKIEAKRVISAIHCHRTWFGGILEATGEKFDPLIDPADAPKDYIDRIKRVQKMPAIASILIALDGLPPSLEGVWMADTGLSYEQFKQYLRNIEDGVPPKKPPLYVITPTQLDPTLAPPGKHWLGACALAPARLRQGTWADVREAFTNILMDAVSDAFPGVREHVIKEPYYIGPDDMMKVYGCLDGHSAPFTFNQMLQLRPGPRSPIKNLYQCGTSVAPFALCTFASGKLVANACLEDIKKKSS